MQKTRCLKTSEIPWLSLDTGGYLLHVRAILARLQQTYEYSNLGNKEDSLDELVFIILSTRTPEKRYQEAYVRVRLLVGEWQNLLSVDSELLAAAIGEAGLSDTKAVLLKRIAEQLKEIVGGVSLVALSRMNTAEAEAFLMRLPGVGRKIAKCVLMYSLGRSVFPIDTHCFRVGKRIGWFRLDRTLTDLELRQAEAAVPSSLRYDLHVRLVQHGRVSVNQSNLTVTCVQLIASVLTTE